MTKKELLKYNPPHKMILEIYEDNDEIPEDIIRLLFYSPPKEREIVIWTNAEGVRLFEEACTQWIRDNYIIGVDPYND